MVAQVNSNYSKSYADTFTYDDNNLSFIGHKGVGYYFDYSEHGELTETRVGNQVISKHSYDENSSTVGTIFGNNQSIEYLYDENNNISDIKINGITYFDNMFNENGQIVSQKDVMNQVNYNYAYDEYSNSINVYYYIKNLQQDIVGIVNDKGEEVVRYTYDDWGNLLTINGDRELGNLNKFRYRSYYYDKESDFYYLKVVIMTVTQADF